MHNVIFDFDGTLVKKDIADLAYQAHAKEVGLELSLDEVQKIQSKGTFFESMHAVLRKTFPSTPEEELVCIDIRLFIHHHQQILSREGKRAYYPGIEEVIKKLSDKYTLSIVSLSQTTTIQGFLAQTGMLRYITHVFGTAGSNPQSKQSIMERAHSLLESIDLSVGDRSSDIIVGNKYGPTIHVLWGHELLNGVKAAEVAQIPEELPILCSYLLGK